MTQINQIQPNLSTEELDDEELVMAHMALHAYYKEFRLGRSKEGWELEDVVQKHEEIKEEIEQRDEIEHDYVSALDNESVEATQSLDIQMGYSEDVAKEWVDDLLQSEDLVEHIKQNPPNADWYAKAVEFIEQEDSSIDVTEHVSFAAQSFDTLDESIQEWIQSATNEQLNAVGYYFNDETETGTLLLEQSGIYSVYVDEVEAETTENQVEALQTYNELSRLIQDGSRRDHALNQIRDEVSWEINQTGEYVATRPDYVQVEGDATPWGKVRDDEGNLQMGAIEELRVQNASGDTPIPANLRDEVETVLQNLSEEVNQGEVRPHAEDDHYWYLWTQEEAESWLQSKGQDVPEPTTEGAFLSYQVRENDGYDEVQAEWFGPSIMPYKFVDGIDERPVFVTIGIRQVEIQEDYTEPVGEVLKYKFLTEEPPHLQDTLQIGTIEADADYYWWKWDQTEIETWARERDHPTNLVEDGDFKKLELQDSDKYDKLYKSWQGKRKKPEETLAGGDKPRRVVYGETEDGEKEVQAIEFLTDPPVEATAKKALNEMGYSDNQIRELVEDAN